MILLQQIIPQAPDLSGEICTDAINTINLLYWITGVTLAVATLVVGALWMRLGKKETDFKNDLLEKDKLVAEATTAHLQDLRTRDNEKSINEMQVADLVKKLHEIIITSKSKNDVRGMV